MKTKNAWDALLSRFFILFNLTKPYERPSKKQTKISKGSKQLLADVMIEGEILPEKETVMLDEVCGYTRTKVRIKQVLTGSHRVDEIIEIYEPYYEGYYRGEKCLMVHEDYQPLRIGHTYQLILTHKQEEMKLMPADKGYDMGAMAQEEQLFYQVS